MGEVASIVRALSFGACAKYVCNGASIRSQCCDEEDGCNCDVATDATAIQSTEDDLGVEMDSDEYWCCSTCIMKAHNK